MNKQQTIALFVLLLAGFVTIFDLFVVNVAIVSIEQSLNANLTELTLIIVGYELAFGLLLITGGRLGDIFGKKTLYRIGMLFFIISSTLCAIAPTALLLVIMRFIQGLSSALLFPQVYSSIRVNFNETQAKKAFGYLGMTLGLAAIAGQALGGLLISLNIFELSWRTIFLINIPIGILAIILSKHLQEGKQIKINLDWVVFFLSSSSIGLVLFPVLMLPVWGWEWLSSGLLFSGMIILILFIYWESRLEKFLKTPLLSTQLLLNRAYIVGLGVILCIYGTSSAFPLLVSILLQNGFGLTPLNSGLIFVPSSIGFVMSSFITPKWIQRFGDEVIIWGAVSYGLSYILFISILTLLSPLEDLYLIMPSLFLIGFTQGMIMTPMLNFVLAKVPANLVGMASGLTATLQQIGAAVGATIASVIMQYGLYYTSDKSEFLALRTSVSYSLWFNTFMALCSVLLLWQLIRKKGQIKSKKKIFCK